MSIEPPEETATLPDYPAPLGDDVQRMFDKPNLQLHDPDPYAFANRIWRLTAVFAVLAMLAAGPYLVGQYVFQSRYNAATAEYQAASENIGEIKARLHDFTLASRMVAKKVGPSVVSIYKPTMRGADAQGSGVIVDAEGYVLTNYHVIVNAAGLRVQVDDGREFQASVIGADPATDLALMKIEATGLTAAEWGDSDDLELGDLVWAMGSPFGLSRSITFGIVSAKHRSSSSGIQTASVYQEYLQTDVAVNPGNSGGPLVDIEGKVVGINTAIIGEAFQGVSFAIPSQLAKEKYEQLRANKVIQRGYLGVEPQRVPERVRRNLELTQGQGVFVSDVVRNGPASLGGMRRGDVILQWNDHQASDPTQLSRTIASTRIGSQAAVLVKRVEGGKVIEKSLNVEVGLKPFAEQALGKE